MHHQRKAARRHRRAPEREGAPSLSAVCKRVLPALPITVAVGLLLLFVTAALLLRTKDPGRYGTPAALAVLYLTALAGGFIAARLAHRRLPLLCGLAEGAFLLVFCTVTGLFLPKTWQGVSGGMAVLTRSLLFPAAVAGALLGARKKKRRRR